MSGTPIEYGSYTDDEIACGLPYAMARGYWPGDEPEHTSALQTVPSLNIEQQFIVDKFVLDLTKAIYPLKNLEAVQQVSIKKLLQYGSSIAIRRYGKSESLPRRYQLLAQNRDCVIFLLHDFFLRVENISVTPALNKRIEILAKTLEKKDHQNLAYQHVAMVRTFIYQEIDAIKGQGHALQSPREEMRQLLSTARLHFCINELAVYGASDLLVLQKRYVAQAAIEYALPTVNEMAGRKNIYRWRYRHQRSLSYFLPKEIRLILLDYINKQDLFALSLVASLNEYKEQVIDKYRTGIMRYLAARQS